MQKDASCSPPPPTPDRCSLEENRNNNAATTDQQEDSRHHHMAATLLGASYVADAVLSFFQLVPIAPNHPGAGLCLVAPILQMRKLRFETLLILCHLAQLVRGEAKPAPLAGFRVLYPPRLLCPPSSLKRSVRTEEPTGVVAALTR